MIEEFTMLTENALDLVRLACQKLHPKGDLEKQLTQLKDNLTSVKVFVRKNKHWPFTNFVCYYGIVNK